VRICLFSDELELYASIAVCWCGFNKIFSDTLYVLYYNLKIYAICIARNIVSTVNLDCKLDLQSIKLKAPTAEYNPQASLLIVNGTYIYRILYTCVCHILCYFCIPSSMKVDMVFVSFWSLVILIFQNLRSLYFIWRSLVDL
jgi:hypothetical protein